MDWGRAQSTYSTGAYTRPDVLIRLEREIGVYWYLLVTTALMIAFTQKSVLTVPEAKCRLALLTSGQPAKGLYASPHADQVHLSR